MDLSLIRRLIEDDDPLQTLHEVLTGEIRTPERFAQTGCRGDVYPYLREGEHAAPAATAKAATALSDALLIILETTQRKVR